MHLNFDEHELRPSNHRFKRVVLAPLAHQHEGPRKRQFRRPGEFQPDPISLHGFHELSYLTPQMIHTVTDLFGFDDGGDLTDPSTAPSLPAVPRSPQPPLSHLLSVPSTPPFPQSPTLPRHTDPLLPHTPQVSAISTLLPSTGQLLVASRKPAAPSGRQAFLKRPLVQALAGLAVGLGFLVLVSRLVDVPRTIHLIQHQVTTTHGLVFALLASFSFVLAFCVRAVRWKLFLNPVGNVRTPKVIALFLIGVFLNFALPIRAGEVAKSLILRRTAGIPVHQSLPTITMDKVMDLLPAFFTLAVVPFLGVKLESTFWVVLIMANVVLLGAIVFVLLTAWKRALMIGLLTTLTRRLPGTLGTKIQHFAIGFVDSLLVSAKNPRVLFLAVLLTLFAVACDGAYNCFGFWTIGYPITFGSALFGYMVFNMFYILPNPPGQVGSNEMVGLLIFTGLLHVPPESVTAMMMLFHLWSALLMCAMGMISLSSLGVRFSSIVNMQTKGEGKIAS